MNGLEVGAKVWIPHADNVWELVTVDTVESSLVTFRSEDDDFFVVEFDPAAKKLSVRREDDDKKKAVVYNMKSLPQKNPDFLDGVDDLTSLAFLHEAEILHNLRLRFHQDRIYTYTGPILLAVNPYRQLPLYDEETKAKYHDRPSDTVPPHVYAIADACYRNMIRRAENQSILISGDSGAGKTESTKIAMQYLADVGGHQQSSGGAVRIEQQVLASNPVLEAFGNATTPLNNNSSRFGKYIEIGFDHNGMVMGASIRTYLLEKSRIVFQDKGHRTFHVFYQILRGASDADRERWGISNSDTFKYLCNGTAASQNVDDATMFGETLESMKLMQFSEEDIESVFKVAAAVLHIGNADFQKLSEDQCEVLSGGMKHLRAACATLGLDADALAEALTKKTITTPTESFQKPRSMEEGTDVRDAFAKAVYQRLFAFVVRRINECISVHETSVSTIGILDIFGFEHFRVNSFEQLCINYTNETLQQQFNDHIFREEQKEYQKERIQWDFVDFEDNQHVLDAIDKRPHGILTILDDECHLPRGSEKSFADKVLAAAERPEQQRTAVSAPRFSFPDGGFIIHHYAGEVAYNAASFLEKNRDTLDVDVVGVIRKGTDSFANGLLAKFVENADASGEGSLTGGGRAASRKNVATVASQFKSQLHKLMTLIAETHPHYIRCLKPNGDQMASAVDNALVVDQLRCGGVLEAVRITQHMYPSRLPHREFADRFALLAAGAVPASADKKVQCEKLLQAISLDKEKAQVGRTKVFFRLGVLGALERDRQAKLDGAATAIQSVYRMKLLRRVFIKMRVAMVMVQAHVRRVLAQRELLRRRQLRACVLAQAAIRRLRARRAFLRKKTSVVRVARAWTAHRAWEARKRDAASRIAAAARMHRVRSAYLRRIHGAVAIQSILRMVVQRRKYKVTMGKERERLRLEALARRADFRREDAERRLDEAQRAAKRSHLENQRLKDELERVRAQQQRGADAAASERTTLRAEVDRLRAETRKLRQETTDARDAASRAAREADAARRERDSAKREVTGGGEALARARAEAAAQADQTKQLRERVVALEGQLRALEAKGRSAKDRLARDESRLAEREEEIEQTRQHYFDAAAALERERESLTAASTETSAELAGAKQRIAELEGLLESSQKQCAALTEKGASLESQHAKVESDLSNLRAQHSVEVEAKRAVEEKLRAMEHDYMEARTKVETSRVTMDALENAKKSLERDIEDLRAREERESDRARHAEQTTEMLREQVSEIRKSLQLLELDKAKIEVERDNLSLDVAEYKKRLGEETANLESLQRARKESTARRDIMVREIQMKYDDEVEARRQAEDRVKEIETQLEEAEAERQKEAETREQLLASMSTIGDELEELKKKKKKKGFLRKISGASK